MAPHQQKQFGPLDFSAIRLKLASSEDILNWSFGEVIKPETINYRTQRPEKDGLFSERIFGPTKDWECYCGKYRRIRYKGIVCDKCGVEVTRSAVRRERMAHISLATPVAHIWFFKNIPSQLSLLLDVPLPKLEKVIYYAAYIVTELDEEKKKEAVEQIKSEFKSRKKNIEKEKGIELEDLKEAMSVTKKELESLTVGQILSEQQYHNLSARFGSVFKAGIGAEAIKSILKKIDLKKFEKEISKEAEKEKIDSVKQSRTLRRLKMVSSMAKMDMRPEWMIIDVLPVLPPDLRPMVALDGGRYATSDLNDLYRRVINRNNRLKKLMDLKAPDVIIINEKRMLQEAVDALIDNSARSGSQQMSAQRRPLRSLADMLKGKQGRFRQNLLGKRVDYSGRSVIVVGPHLKLSQCGIPKKMALELFRPFVIAQIIDREMAHNVKNSNKLIERAGPEIWAILEEVIQERKVLLNRAPTLHRLGIQAFEPLLIEDLAIQLHPLVCPAFNADFDGDQMAVHLPLSQEAQREATERMLSSVNLLRPATGEPIVIPSQDIVLGIYYLTRINKKGKGAGKAFSTRQEALLALEMGLIDISAPIKVHSEELGVMETSVGRIILNSALPAGFEYINEELTKKKLNRLIEKVIVSHGIEKAPEYLDAIKNIGFEYATKSGITWSMHDLIIPEQKPAILAEAEAEVAKVVDQFNEGLLTEGERYARIISIWIEAKNKIVELIPLALDQQGPIHAMISSGARGSWNQATQMFGMKGLVQNAQGRNIELPIKSSYKEGLNVLEYFISTHGARKGTTDTALKTAQAGYLTRRLVDVAQDMGIKEEDCRTKKGIALYRADSEEVDYPYIERLFGRTALEDIKDGRKTLVKAGEIIGRQGADAINAAGLDEIKVRSPISCTTLYGICSKCYGFDLGRNESIRKGEAVGVVAAQSIGEPGTQLTMRTFHVGGVAGADITHGLPRVVEIFEARPPKGRAFIAQEAGVVTDITSEDLSKTVIIRPEGGTKDTKAGTYQIPHSSEVLVSIGDKVEKGQKLCEGNLDLKELFEMRSKEDVYREIVKGVQAVYTSEGASINDKHIEIIAKQMFSRVKIKEAGGTEFVPGEIVEKDRFKEANREMKKAGKNPAKAIQMLMGITKVALSTESFLSAASFQETARVLIHASVNGKVDRIRGLKENVIIGRIIPVGENYDGRLRFNVAAEEEEEILDEVGSEEEIGAEE